MCVAMSNESVILSWFEKASSLFISELAITSSSRGRRWWPVDPVSGISTIFGGVAPSAARSGALRWMRTRVVSVLVALICGCGSQPSLISIRNVDASVHCPSYSDPSGSETVNSEST